MSKTAAKLREADVAAPVVKFLERQGLDVYQEVDVIGGVADIVALKGDEVWVIEVKSSWSLDLLDQCITRKRVAHRVWAAVPQGRGWTSRAYLFHLLGIGTLRVRESWRHVGVLEVEQSGPEPALNEPEWKRLRESLRDGHKTHARAGTASAAGRYTEFRATSEALAAYVAERPGVSVKEAVASIEHHYASAASARNHLVDWVERGKIAGVRVARDDAGTWFFPAERDS